MGDGSRNIKNLRLVLTLLKSAFDNEFQKGEKNGGDVLSWDQYFMGMAHLSTKRSKDPNTRVGACIVNPQKKTRRTWIQWFSLWLRR